MVPNAELALADPGPTQCVPLPPPPVAIASKPAGVARAAATRATKHNVMLVV